MLRAQNLDLMCGFIHNAQEKLKQSTKIQKIGSDNSHKINF